MRTGATIFLTNKCSAPSPEQLLSKSLWAEEYNVAEFECLRNTHQKNLSRSEGTRGGFLGSREGQGEVSQVKRMERVRVEERISGSC